ncbi:Hypothetical protein NAEGRDRAFT_65309 [Naegleria gruberi]|uniref:Uncharacterized protein n=1 Tax=Naegleria gruberi TaxID=5762 RepID=D2V8W7_NAEGR|nr:uncharacterized protein NAEGRDRAFT_65309 [Naegleria gruberi]EFC46763.1 Hypothetical protein NAEGRDRAFT_65309 [Naegleria gruberi]|eukprot:XP_002679507.1 Hypothetical protein NAEGRDRAFT_65309 [Naegleria gruberi strain NEG-M]
MQEINEHPFDDLIISKILEYLSSSTLEIINLGQVCKSFRRICLHPSTKLSFSNYLSKNRDENCDEYNDHDTVKEYLPFNWEACFDFLQYFTTIDLGCQFGMPDAMDYIVNVALASTKIEELYLKNCEIYALTNVNCKISRLECCQVVVPLQFESIIQYFPYLKHLKVEDCHVQLECSPKLQMICECLESLVAIDSLKDLFTINIQFGQLTELTFISTFEQEMYFEKIDYCMNYENFPKLKKLTLKVPSKCIQLDLPILEELVLEAEIDYYDFRSMHTMLKLENLKKLETTSFDVCKANLIAPNLETLIIRDEFNIVKSWNINPIPQIDK